MTDKPDDNKGLGAPAASRHRATDPSDGAAKASPRFASVSTGAASYTPGPWWVEDRRHVQANRGGGALQVQAQHRGEGSSYCVASVNFWEATEANASLIAAAPDLFEALESQVIAFTNLAGNVGFSSADIADCTAQARAALTKARGE
jgi:hypothetical protein